MSEFTTIVARMKQLEEEVVAKEDEAHRYQKELHEKQKALQQTAFESLHHLNRNFAVLYLIRLSIKITLIGTMKNKLITTVTQPHPFFPFKGDLLYQSVFHILETVLFVTVDFGL
jgi:dTDP-4-amino-4,6-dideoxygalactose transaminase